MNLDYLILRAIRHFMPERLTRFLLLRSVVIRPGLETSEPEAAAQRYVRALEDRGRTLVGRRILVFGYGGRFDIGVHLLEAGAGHVVLYDKFALPDHVHNLGLATRNPAYIRAEKGRAFPRPETMTIWRDIGEAGGSGATAEVDYVVSTSVYEHLAEVDGSTQALAALTRSNGLHIHFVDLRDHFFKYPFEMLHYSNATWQRWLNPTSNLNRYRLWDYRRVFEAFFRKVDIEVLQRDEVGFSLARDRIRSEFKRGLVQDDAVTLIRIVAEEPRPAT